MILLAGIGYDDYARRHIVINEVCAHNLSLALDDRGRGSDYIELYNPSFTPYAPTNQKTYSSRFKLCCREKTAPPKNTYSMPETIVRICTIRRLRRYHWMDGI